MHTQPQNYTLTANDYPKKVLLLGSGGLRISQAGEFDYSGSQAIKALKEQGVNVVLVNPNIATVQTDSSMADTLYLEPLLLDPVTKIIEKERPDAILLSFGGQTALNLGLQLAKKGVLDKYQVRVLGSSIATIEAAEDRELFKKHCEQIDVKTARSICVDTIDDALQAAQKIGYPLMIRSGFSLGGLGSGIVHNDFELKTKASEALAATPHVLIEECLIGWSEFEYEIVRDRAGNVVTVCNMENFDPMGIHTGESIVVCPSQTLNNREYHFLRDIAIQVANHFQIIGECNIQYAYNSKTGDYRVIEINPRLSRSSALASKATGYPLAFVAAKLALGQLLHAVKNSITQKTCAFFEPALDYVVVKMPRWDTHKLKSAQRRIGTEMKSVGEVMGIGRTFAEALQKAVGMLNIGPTCLSDYPAVDSLIEEIKQPTDRRLFAIYQAFLKENTLADLITWTQINSWFLQHLQAIAALELRARQSTELTPALLLELKKAGMSDQVIAFWYSQSESWVRQRRKDLKIVPFVKQIDTVAGEFAAKTNYLYLTYHAQHHDLAPAKQSPVVVLGSGPYSIGSSVEFDWCGVNTLRTLNEMGELPIMINSNPETVSTDYDESGRLYFEQLTLERVRDIIDFENPKGVIVSVGGQVANNLVGPLAKAGYPILGTSAESIDRAENRAHFSQLLNTLDVDQPQWAHADSVHSAKAFVDAVGYPVLLRPSYVLSGAAMNIVFNDQELKTYLTEASLVSREHPVVISKFIQDAKELQIDGVAEKGEMVIYAISEHIENAGVHSGDATVVLPPQRLYLETIRLAKRITKKIIKALNITGPFNMQFIAKNNTLKVIECNVRASRSFPFASKVTNHNFIKIATEVLMGIYKKQRFQTLEFDYVAVKTSQFSYHRLKGANPVANVEMASTGEVACFGSDLLEAFYKSWQATEQFIKDKKVFLSLGGDKKSRLLELVRKLDALGWQIFTTEGTHDYLAEKGIATSFVYKASDHREPSAASLITDRAVNLIINLPTSPRSSFLMQVTDGFLIRRLAIDHNIPLITNLQSAILTLRCLTELDPENLPVKSWQEFTLRE